MRRDEVIRRTIRHLQTRGYYPKKNIYMRFPNILGGVYVDILVKEEERSFMRKESELHTIGFECRGDSTMKAWKNLKTGINNAHFNLSFVDEYYVVVPESWESLIKDRIFEDFIQRTGIGIWLCGDIITELSKAKRVLWVMEEDGRRGGIRETPRKHYEPMRKPRKKRDLRELPWDDLLETDV